MYNVDIIWHRFTKKLGEEKKKKYQLFVSFRSNKKFFCCPHPPIRRSQKNPKMKMKIIEIGGHPFQAKNLENWAVVVAQWVERLLPRPEICGSTPVMSKFYFPSTVLNLY